MCTARYLEIKEASDRLCREHKVINAADNRNEVNSSTKEALTRLNKCFEYAVAGGILSRNPCTFVELPYRKEKAQEETPLSQREEEIFMREIDTSWYKEMFFFMCLTGVRVGELGGLCWSDIDFDRKVIRITHSLTSQYENGEKILLLNTPKTVNSFREIPFIGDMEDGKVTSISSSTVNLTFKMAVSPEITTL